MKNESLEIEYLRVGLCNAQLRKVKDLQEGVRVLIGALGGVAEIRRHFRSAGGLDNALIDNEFNERLIRQRFPSEKFTLPYGMVPHTALNDPEFLAVDSQDIITIADVVRGKIFQALCEAFISAVFPGSHYLAS